jgi:hypothetical protein
VAVYESDYTIWASDAPISVQVPLPNAKKNAKFTARDLWTGTELANLKKHTVTINPHGAQLLKIK